jgi:hypothetical protein
VRETGPRAESRFVETSRVARIREVAGREPWGCGGVVGSGMQPPNAVSTFLSGQAATRVIEVRLYCWWALCDSTDLGTQRLTDSLTRVQLTARLSRSQSLSQSLGQSVSQSVSLTHPLTNSLTYSLTHSQMHSSLPPLLARLLTHSHSPPPSQPPSIHPSQPTQLTWARGTRRSRFGCTSQPLA